MTDEGKAEERTEDGDVLFNFTPPVRCTGCGRKSSNMTIENGKGWLIIPVAPGIMLYACTGCQTVHTNTEALYNTNKANDIIQAQKESRIIVPGQKSLNSMNN